MSAVTVVESLVKLAVVVADAAAGNTKSGKFDFAEFLQSQAPTAVANAVSSLLAALNPSDIQSAIAAVSQKQQALLAGQQLADLGTDKLVQYSALTDTKLALRTALVKRAAQSDFFSWLQNGGLGDLVKIAQTVVPLLL